MHCLWLFISRATVWSLYHHQYCPTLLDYVLYILCIGYYTSTPICGTHTIQTLYMLGYCPNTTLRALSLNYCSLSLSHSNMVQLAAIDYILSSKTIEIEEKGGKTAHWCEV